MKTNPQNLAERILSLDPEQIAEVEDFVEFLRRRSEEKMFARAASELSAPVFDAIWSNPEDDAYDAL